jgi:hypothetical protein
VIFSHVLYQLSYLGAGTRAAGPKAKRARLYGQGPGGVHPPRPRGAAAPALFVLAIAARARILLDDRHRVAALEPAVEVDVGAALRAERAKTLQRRLAAERAALGGAGRGLIHGRDVGVAATN